MPAKSKIKGNKHERETAKILAAWWGEPFQRTPNSGALRWNGASWVYGDLLPPESFPGVVECKHYANVDLDAVIRCAATGDSVRGWWDQTLGDAQRCYEETGHPVHPVLIYKENRVPRRIVLEADFYVAVGGRTLGIPTFWVSHPEIDAPFVILDLQAFLSTVSRETFLEASRKTVPARLVERVAA